MIMIIIKIIIIIYIYFTELNSIPIYNYRT